MGGLGLIIGALKPEMTGNREPEGVCSVLYPAETGDYAGEWEGIGLEMIWKEQREGGLMGIDRVKS